MNMKKILLAALLLLAAIPSIHSAEYMREITVAADGSGDSPLPFAVCGFPITIRRPFFLSLATQ